MPLVLAELDDRLPAATRAAQVALARRLLVAEPGARPAPLDAPPLAADPAGVLARSLTMHAAIWRAELPTLRRQLAVARASFRAHENLRRALHLIDAWRDLAAALTAAAAAAALLADLRSLELARCSR